MTRNDVCAQPKTSGRLVSFLQSPDSYPHHLSTVRMIETHISWVFIASPFVFKVKKPVDLGFADFSTLEKRKHFCERELALNRRLCPDVYLEVVPIYERGGTLSFTPGDQIIEYALKMRELPDGWFLNQLLIRHEVGEDEINRIVARLHDFYAAENPSAEIEEWGRPAKLKLSTDENFVQIKPFIGKTITRAAFETIRHYTSSFFESHERLFQERIARRRILDCHGDLRLEHVHITPDAVTIFDCIEFNDRFRFIDIANDLAFLAMDFDFEGRHDLANLFLRTAARAFGDPGILKLTDFYKCYRAVVRGKVESIAAITEHIRNTDEHARRAQLYFRLALRYAVIGSEPGLLVIMGRVATGKSSVAVQLASELDWPVFSSDQIRKSVAGLPLTERTPTERRAQLYSEQAKREVYAKLVHDGLAAVSQFGGAVIDATFSRRADRHYLREEARRTGVGLQLIELDAPNEQLVARLRARAAAISGNSDAREEDFEKLDALYESAGTDEYVIEMQASGAVANTSQAVMRALATKQADGHGFELFASKHERSADPLSLVQG